MEKSVEKTAANKSKIAVWDCGSTLYDSFELNSFKRQLDSTLVRRSLSMPHSTNHRATPPPPSQPQLNIVAAKKSSEKIYRSLSKLIRSVFRTRPNNSGSIFRLLQDGSNTDGPFYVVYDTSGALTTIPEAPEIDFGGLSPEIGSLVRRTSSERFSATSLGAAGYIGSLLVKKLLEKGHSVHATLRNLGDESKVSLLKSLPNSDSNLVLFQADIYNPTQFQTAIHGCQFVFHVATPLLHNTSHTSQYKNTSDAAVAGVKQIANSCIQSQTVKRLIYTASVVSCTSHNFPEHEDGSVLYMKPTIDESCWTPLDVSFKHATNMLQDYTKSKTLAEKEVLSYNNIEVEEYGKLEVVSIPCGLVGGKTLLPYLPTSVEVLLSPFISSQSIHINSLMYLQEVIGSIPLVHVEDVCEAHIFCMEQQSIRGRFLCAVSNPTLKDIALYYHQNYPQFEISKELMEGPDLGSLFDLMKLTKMGFKYKYDMKKILDETLGWKEIW